VALQIRRRRKSHLGDEPEQRTIACPLPARITIKTLRAPDVASLERLVEHEQLRAKGGATPHRGASPAPARKESLAVGPIDSASPLGRETR
jgi:hypothetical protein